MSWSLRRRCSGSKELMRFAVSGLASGECTAMISRTAARTAGSRTVRCSAGGQNAGLALTAWLPRRQGDTMTTHDDQAVSQTSTVADLRCSVLLDVWPVGLERLPSRYGSHA